MYYSIDDLSDDIWAGGISDIGNLCSTMTLQKSPSAAIAQKYITLRLFGKYCTCSLFVYTTKKYFHLVLLSKGSTSESL